jgi:aspartyl/asparaginyl beta-hydroxylase (cupin superfamily)
MELELSARLKKSVELLGTRQEFEDGRKPMYYALMDLRSKPFYRAHECEGVEALLKDLHASRALLLEEALSVQALARDQGKTQGKGWSVRILSVDGKVDPCTEECPKLMQILLQHPCVELTHLMAACTFSYLEPGGAINPHHGPVNFKLRVQFPLTDTTACQLFCGNEMTVYPDGYAIIDDSYRHFAENNGEHVRVVLVLDIWHPGVELSEQLAITELLRQSSVQ